MPLQALAFPYRPTLLLLPFLYGLVTYRVLKDLHLAYCLHSGQYRLLVYLYYLYACYTYVVLLLLYCLVFLILYYPFLYFFYSYSLYCYYFVRVRGRSFYVGYVRQREIVSYNVRWICLRWYLRVRNQKNKKTIFLQKQQG